MRRIIGTVALVVLATACASTATSSEPDALAMVSDEALIALDDTELALVELEASWMCDAQRRSSVEPGVVDRARDLALAASDITIDEYTAFQLALEQRRDLREAVLARFIEVCDAP